jgi:hypothetical protein
LRLSALAGEQQKKDMKRVGRRTAKGYDADLNFILATEDQYTGGQVLKKICPPVI